MAKLFFSYSHIDEELRDQLEVQLAMLKRQGIIDAWHDRRIGAGQEFDHDISRNLEDADIILLLASPHFLASEYCYDQEMVRAMERHERGEAVVIPVILRACEWREAPFGKLLATPRDGKPIVQAVDRDEAFLEVARVIRKAAEKLAKTSVQAVAGVPAPTAVRQQTQGGLAPDPARSSNLRITKRFTERDKDAFRLSTFEYMARFFEASLEELGRRNDGVEGQFRRIDGNRFTAVAYLDGKATARCTVFMDGGSGFVSGIAYSASETSNSNGYNEMLFVEHDEQSLFLKSMGMAHRGGGGQKLSEEGGAELYWAMFIEPLQRRR